MTKVDIDTVLTIFDRKAAEFKRFGSSHRRIQAIRDELEKLKVEDEHSADIHERVRQTDAMNVQEYHKSAQRIAAMIKDADERELW